MNNRLEFLTKTIGVWYLSQPDLSETQYFKHRLDRYKKDIDKRFEKLRQEFNVQYVQENPYKSLEDLIKDIEGNRRIRVYSNGSHPSYLTLEENLKSRALHDYYGHYLGGKSNYFHKHDFSVIGEICCYLYQEDYFEDEILFNEIVGQVCAHHVLGEFAKQKLVKFPEFMMYELQVVFHSTYVPWDWIDKGSD